MNYQITYADDTSIIVSGGTLSQVIAHSKTISKELSYIGVIIQEIIVLEQNSNVCFSVQGKNTSTNTRVSYLIFHTNIDNVNTWIQSQSNLEVDSLSKSQKTLAILS